MISIVLLVLVASSLAQQPTIAPLSYTAFLDPSDVSVRFTCTGEGFVSWMVDGNPATETEIIKRGIFTDSNEEGGNFTSQITIPATVENNNTEVQCFATLENRSEVVSFKVQGPLGPPPNLTIVDNEADACSIKLVWSAPFTLDVSGVDPDISTYTICSNITGYCSSTSGSGVMEHVFPRPFRYVEFRVSAVNGAGQGNESLVVYEPNITISTNVSLKNPGSPNVSISFQANCSMNYSILIANGNSTVCDHTAMPDENGTVMFNIDDGLKTNEEYNFTVAENSTESVEDMMDDPSGSFTTFDVQHEEIRDGPGEIRVTCYFAVGSQALGCHAIIYMSTTYVTSGDIRRENTTDSSSMKWYLSDSATKVFSGLEVGTYSVYLSDIERDSTTDPENRLHIETVEITEIRVTPTSTAVEFADTSTSIATETTKFPQDSDSLTVIIPVTIMMVLVAFGGVFMVVIAFVLCHKRNQKCSRSLGCHNSAEDGVEKYTSPSKDADTVHEPKSDTANISIDENNSKLCDNDGKDTDVSDTVKIQKPQHADASTSTEIGEELQNNSTGIQQDEDYYGNTGTNANQSTDKKKPFDDVLTKIEKLNYLIDKFKTHLKKPAPMLPTSYIPPSSEKKKYESPITTPPSPPVPTSPVAVDTAIDQHMETMSLPGSLPDHDDSCDIDALDVACQSAPASHSTSEYEMDGMPQDASHDSLVSENSDCSDSSVLVYPGAKKCFGPISDYKIDLSYKHQTEPQEMRPCTSVDEEDANVPVYLQPPKRRSDNDSFHIKIDNSILIQEHTESPIKQNVGRKKKVLAYDKKPRRYKPKHKHPIKGLHRLKYHRLLMRKKDTIGTVIWKSNRAPLKAVDLLDYVKSCDLFKIACN